MVINVSAHSAQLGCVCVHVTLCPYAASSVDPVTPQLYIFHPLPADDWLSAPRKEIPQGSIAAPLSQNWQMEAEDIGSIIKKKRGMDNYTELFYGLSGDGCMGMDEEKDELSA